MAAFSPAGRRLWVATWRGPAHLRDGVNDLAVTTSGKAYVVGWLGARSGSDAMIRQYDAAGHFVWQATYATKGGGRYRFVAVALLPHGGVAATGNLVDSRTGDSNIVTLGFAAHGPSLWQQVWDTRHAAGRVSKDVATDLTVDASRPRVRRRQRVARHRRHHRLRCPGLHLRRRGALESAAHVERRRSAASPGLSRRRRAG